MARFSGALIRPAAILHGPTRILRPDRVERRGAETGVALDQILHTAQSLYHDHVPAGDFGLARAWIDRRGLSKGGAWGATAEVPERPEVDFLFPTLAAMADAVEAETRG